MIEVYDAVKQDELDILSFVDWENLVNVDIAFPVHRVGLLVDSLTNPTVDEREFSPKLLGKKWAMEKNGWRITLVNYEAFKSSGTEYVAGIRSQLTEVKIFRKGDFAGF